MPSPSPCPRATTEDRPSHFLSLVHAWRNGDQRAGEALFRDVRAMLVARLRGCPPHVVDDLVQDALVACVLARDSLRHDKALVGYARCVVHRRLMHHRYRTRTHDALDEALVADVRPTAHLDHQLEARAMLESCSAPLAVVIALHYLEGYRGTEIARMLGISEAGVRRRLRRGLGQLQARVGAAT